MKLQQFMQLIFPNCKTSLVQIFNRIDLYNCLRSNQL